MDRDNFGAGNSDVVEIEVETLKRILAKLEDLEALLEEVTERLADLDLTAYSSLSDDE